MCVCRMQQRCSPTWTDKGYHGAGALVVQREEALAHAPNALHEDSATRAMAGKRGGTGTTRSGLTGLTLPLADSALVD